MKTRRRTACPFEILEITESLFFAVLLLRFMLSFSPSYYSAGSKCTKYWLTYREWTDVQTSWPSRDYQNFSHLYVTTFTYPWFSPNRVRHNEEKRLRELILTILAKEKCFDFYSLRPHYTDSLRKFMEISMEKAGWKGWVKGIWRYILYFHLCRPRPTSSLGATSSAELLHGTIYLVRSSNFWVWVWNPKMWPFEWNLFSRTFT